MIDKIKPKGRYIVKYTDEKTGRKWEEVFDNTVTSGMFAAIFEFLNQAISNPDCDALNITHLALGTGTTSATRSDVKLVTEYARKPVGFKSFSSVKFTTETPFAANEGNPTGEFIKEVGTFAKATDTLDSGLLLSRATVNIYKTASVSIIIVWELTF